MTGRVTAERPPANRCVFRSCVPTRFECRCQVHMPANKLRKVIAQRDEFQHTHRSVEIHQHIEIAVFALLSADVGAEQGKRRHTVVAL